MAKTTVDMSKFAASMRQLSTLSGKDLKTVMVDRAGKVLETAVRYTPKADREKIKAQIAANTKFRFENHDSDAGTYYKTKKTGTEWFTNDPTKAKWYLIHKWHVPDKVWAAYKRVLSENIEDFQRTLTRRLKEALAARGLSAKTWLQIGNAIGAIVKAPAYVQKAVIPDAIGSGTVSTTDTHCTVSGGNASNVLIKTRTGQGIIDRAIRSQVKYIETAIRKGSLNTLQSRTRAFPGLFKDAA
ncbi:MAG: hypothetical protein Q7S40_03540 [Opitutaceae bacterium]|nr:hypothetical protein [Opitutaceae bacterium]